MKPLVSLDLEATGTNTATDAIVSIALTGVGITDLKVNVKPWRSIPPHVAELIRIDDAKVAKCKPFSEVAKMVHERIAGCDLLGFGINTFDVPLLWEEFHRAGIVWDLSKHLIIDAGALWKKLEERTLEAAVQKFLGTEHTGAHDAFVDAVATVKVFNAMRGRFPQLAGKSIEEIAELSKFDQQKAALTLDGKIIKGPDGDPVFNFGKSKGVKVKDDIGFAEWILGKDFPANTRIWLERYLDSLNGTPQLALQP